MKKTVLTFGLISGVVSAALMASFAPFIDRIGFDRGMIVGYAAMVVAFSLVFFGVRSYRENVSDGYISFGRGFAIGILITLISSVFYVIAWEIIYFGFLPDFADKYGAYIINNYKQTGATAEQIAAKTAELRSMKAVYDNPLFNGLITLTEPLPIGILVSLISALILRKRRKPDLQLDGVTA